MAGFEPAASSTRTTRASKLRHIPLADSGGLEPQGRDPVPLSKRSPTPSGSLSMVGLDRIERSTSPLSGVRSNQLSYKPYTVAAER